MHLRSLRSRTGFTLVECLVAVTLLAVGLLGLAGTSLAVQRLTTSAARRAGAAAMAWARLERLRGTACAARASGASASHGLAESWSVAAAPGTTFVTDSLLLPPAAGRAVPPVALATGLPC